MKSVALFSLFLTISLLQAQDPFPVSHPYESSQISLHSDKQFLVTRENIGDPTTRAELYLQDSTFRTIWGDTMQYDYYERGRFVQTEILDNGNVVAIYEGDGCDVGGQQHLIFYFPAGDTLERRLHSDYMWYRIFGVNEDHDIFVEGSDFDESALLVLNDSLEIIDQLSIGDQDILFLAMRESHIAYIGLSDSILTYQIGSGVIESEELSRVIGMKILPSGFLTVNTDHDVQVRDSHFIPLNEIQLPAVEKLAGMQVLGDSLYLLELNVDEAWQISIVNLLSLETERHLLDRNFIKLTDLRLIDSTLTIFGQHHSPEIRDIQPDNFSTFVEPLGRDGRLTTQQDVSFLDIEMLIPAVYDSFEVFDPPFSTYTSYRYSIDSVVLTVKNNGNTTLHYLEITQIARTHQKEAYCHYEYDLSRRIDSLDVDPGETTQILLRNWGFINSRDSPEEFALCFWLNSPNRFLDIYPEDNVLCDDLLLSTRREPAPTSLSVFPNPSFDEFYLTLEQKRDFDLEVINNQGVVIRKNQYTNCKNTTLNLWDQPAGLYHLMIRGEDGLISSTKIVKY